MVSPSLQISTNSHSCTEPADPSHDTVWKNMHSLMAILNLAFQQIQSWLCGHIQINKEPKFQSSGERQVLEREKKVVHVQSSYIKQSPWLWTCQPHIQTQAMEWNHSLFNKEFDYGWVPSPAEMVVELWPAPNGSNSLSERFVKPERPAVCRRVGILDLLPVRILCG